MKAVLFSGGVDSLCHLRWAQNRFGMSSLTAVYFDVGQAYARRESERARELALQCGVPFRLFSPMRLPEDPVTAQVEFRNAFLVLWAALLIPDCDGVVFGMLQGEAPPDKTPRFARRMEGIIRDCRAPSIYGPGQRFRLHVPFERHTKSEMVRWYVQRYGTEMLAETVGCFRAELPMCGACWSCFNRWLAWEENGLSLEPYSVHPASWALRRFRETWQHGGRERRGLTLSRLWSRRRWAREVWRQLDKYARRVKGRSAVQAVRG